MKFYLPYWEDKLDPDFDFIADDFSLGHKESPFNYDKYIHELISDGIYDGILVSLGVFISKMKLNENEGKHDIKGYSDFKSYLRFSESNKPLKLLGDCGAFNYVNEPEPPEEFNPKRVSYIYNLLKFDYGISVDHLVIPTIQVKDSEGNTVKKELTLAEMEQRIKISLDNADEFIKLTSKNKYCYIPIGSAQGYSPETYKKSVAQLVEMGYDYIALGGLARSNTKDILSVLKEVAPELRGRNLHLLGVLRPDSLNEFQKYGVTSFDSASYLRKAWLRSGQNYLCSETNKWYTAIRVPQATSSRMAKSAALLQKEDEIQTLERECLDLLRRYDQGEVGVNKVIDTIVYYDSILERNGNDGKDLREKYSVTLSEKPWKKCSCELCSTLGIDIVIFRGTNRNKRRGFHNTKVFYDILTIFNTSNQEIRI